MGYSWGEGGGGGGGTVKNSSSSEIGPEQLTHLLHVVVRTGALGLARPAALAWRRALSAALPRCRALFPTAHKLGLIDVRVIVRAATTGTATAAFLRLLHHRLLLLPHRVHLLPHRLILLLLLFLLLLFLLLAVVRL